MYYLGIDLGGTNIVAGVVDEDGNDGDHQTGWVGLPAFHVLPSGFQVVVVKFQ